MFLTNDEIEDLIENFFWRNSEELNDDEDSEKQKECKCKIRDIWNFGNDGHKKGCPEKK